MQYTGWAPVVFTDCSNSTTATSWKPAAIQWTTSGTGWTSTGCDCAITYNSDSNFIPPTYATTASPFNCTITHNNTYAKVPYTLTYNDNFTHQVASIFARWESVADTWKFYDPVESRKDHLKTILKSRHSPAIRTNTKPVGRTNDQRELYARDRLKRVIGEEKYRNFLRTGWVTVKAKSGLTYRIFPGHGITQVYNKGQMTERLCVALSGDWPPTDSLIIRYILILNNEQMFRSKAVPHGVTNDRSTMHAVDDRSLVEIAKSFRLAG